MLTKKDFYEYNLNTIKLIVERYEMSIEYEQYDEVLEECKDLIEIATLMMKNIEADKANMV